MSLIGNYAPDLFTIVLSKGNFVHQISGFADGTFLSMDRIVPSSEPYQGVGLKGSWGRVKRSVTAMNCTITLHQYSPSNSVLQQLQLADANDPGNEWVFSATISDLSGQTIASTNSAVIAAPPNVSFSNTTETRDWNIYMFGTDLFIGGNTPLDAADQAAISAAGGTTDDRWKA
jgi:hypothetical protein